MKKILIGISLYCINLISFLLGPVLKKIMCILVVFGTSVTLFLLYELITKPQFSILEYLLGAIYYLTLFVALPFVSQKYMFIICIKLRNRLSELYCEPHV